MVVKTKTEIVIATWPESTGCYYYGDMGYGDMGTCGSAWISLRGVAAKGTYDFSDAVRAIKDVGLWVFFSSDGHLTIEPRLHEVHSADVRQTEAALKVLKRITAALAKAPGLGLARANQIEIALQIACDAIGIKRSVAYRPGVNDDTYSNAYFAIGLISKDILGRIEKLKPHEQSLAVTT